ncbi:hypothetical protein ACC848_38585, partial [Rhizobium johnstonii]
MIVVVSGSPAPDYRRLMSLAATHPDRTDDASGRHDQRVADHAAAVVGPLGPAAFVWGDFVIGPG